MSLIPFVPCLSDYCFSQYPRLVPVSPVVGLDPRFTSLPPLTSFLGWRSRIMASFMSFLSRRQTDRTTLTLGSCVFLLKQTFPQFMVANVLATTPSQSKLKNGPPAYVSGTLERRNGHCGDGLRARNALRRDTGVGDRRILRNSNP